MNSAGATGTVPQADRERLLLQIARSLNSTLELEEALQAVLCLVGEALDAAAVSVFVPQGDEHSDELNITFARRGGPLETVLLSTELGLSGGVMRAGEPVLVTDVREAPGYRATLESAFGIGTRALLAVPLRRRGEVIGLIEAVRERPRPFGAPDLEFLEAISDEVAVAVENATLVQRLQHDLAERQLLLEVSRQVGSSLDIAEVFDQIFDSLMEVVPYDAAGIFLVDRASSEIMVSAQRGYSDLVVNT